MLDERQIKVCHLLSVGTPVVDIAKEMGVSRRTIYDWKKQPEMEAMAQELAQDFISQMIATGRSYAPKAMKQLIYLAEHAKSDKGKYDALAKIIDKYMSNATKVEIDMTKDSDAVTVDMLDEITRK